MYQGCEMRIPSENSNTDYSLVYISKNEFFLHNEKGGNESESYFLCIHRQQVSKLPTVTLMLPYALEVTLARIRLYPIASVFIIMLSKNCAK